MTLGDGVPLTLQSNRALRPSITSRMSSLRVKRGSSEGMTLSLPHEVTSSEEWKHLFRSSRRTGGQNNKYIYFNFTSCILWYLITFSCAKLARVCPTVILVYRVEQQTTLPPIKVHLTVKQCWLDQFPICKPVHISVLRSDDMTLEQNCLPGLGCDVPDWADDSQTRLNWWGWV